MIVDTDVLVDYLRGYGSARRMLATVADPAISIVTLFELYQGARNKAEFADIKRFLKEWTFRVIPVTEEQSFQTQFLMERYSLSHGLKMADALIAACALCAREDLLTGNASHFKSVKELATHSYTR